MFSFEHRCKWLSVLVFIPFYATSLQSQEPSPEPDTAWIQNYSTVKFDGQDTPKDMFVDESGNMTLGYGFVAYPYSYLSTGINTFIINNTGTSRCLMRAGPALPHHGLAVNRVHQEPCEVTHLLLHEP